MPIIADIEDLEPAELLLVLAMTRKTGRLCATRDGQKILFALRHGAIVYAASPAARERLGSILVNRGALTERDLHRALERQSVEVEPRVLGTILIEMGLVSPTTIQEAIQCQFEAVLRHLMSWDRGVMSFYSCSVPDLGAVPVDPAEVFAGVTRETRVALAEGVARLTLRGRDRSGLEEEADEPVEEAAEDLTDGARGESVRAMLQEMNQLSVSLTAEMTMAILRAAADIAPRALLLLVSSDHLAGIGGFGSAADGRPVAGRMLRISHGRGSLFGRVASRGEPYRGRLEIADAEALEGPLGHLPAGEVLLVPLVVDGVVVALLYADGGPKGETIGDVGSLRAAMERVAQALAAEREARQSAVAAG